MRFYLILLLLPLPAWSQNIVPNGSFECGEDFCNAFQTPQLDEFSRFACFWSVPTTGTTDIFSTLIPVYECYGHMPYYGEFFHQGTQWPRTGNRFAGIYTYSQGRSSDTTSYREYLQIKLNNPLKQGETYCAEMYVSHSEAGRWAANNLGMRFNMEPIRTFDFKTLPLEPQIIEHQIIKDTSNWVRIGNFFIPDQNYPYLLIGNFFYDGSTAGELQVRPQQIYNYAYYFIDDVTVEKLPYDNFTIQAPAGVCEGQPVELSASAGVDDEVIWTTLQDTTQIIHLGENYQFVADTTVAFRVLAKGCKKRVVDTVWVHVNQKPIVALGSDTTLCRGQRLKLNAGEFNSYKWQDGSTSSVFETVDQGVYSVEVTDNFQCQETDEIIVSYIDVPFISLGADTIVCNKFYTIQAGGNDYRYTWFDGSTGNSVRPSKSGAYWVTAKNQCGVITDTVTVILAADIIMPNVVTLNSDGYNDYLKFGYLDDLGRVNLLKQGLVGLTVYNRWGNEVFNTWPYKNNWPQGDQEGIFYYYVILPGCKELKGWIQVIR